jgi:predicted nucleic acid-binding protein
LRNAEIILEYEEIFHRFWCPDVINNLLGLFELSYDFKQVQIYGNWRLVRNDDDNNKFIDTFIATRANVLVSNDSSITTLKNNNLPH